MKAVVAAFNQKKALVGAFSVITNLRMELFEALLLDDAAPVPAVKMSRNLLYHWAGTRGGEAASCTTITLLGWSDFLHLFVKTNI